MSGFDPRSPVSGPETAEPESVSGGWAGGGAHRRPDRPDQADHRGQGNGHGAAVDGDRRRGSPVGGPAHARGPGPARDRWALLRLAVAVAAIVAAFVLFGQSALLVVILAVIAMVMIHELGHFVAAKASGMKVTEYFFGFGPKLWSVRKGETEYGVKALPAGGYVKITGMTMLEQVEEGDEARSYRQASFPRRLAVAVAGSFMHMVMALALCWSFFVFVGSPVATSPYVVALLRFSHGKTPAQLAGLRNGDRFVSIDGKKVHTFSALEAEVGVHAGKPLRVVVERHGRLLHLVVRPVAANKVTEYAGGVALRSTSSRGIIGVELSSGANRPTGPLSAVPRAFVEFGSLVKTTVQGLGQVFSFHGLDQFAHSVATAGRHQAAKSAGKGGAAASGSGSSSSGSSDQIMSILGVVEVGSQAAKTNPGLLLLLLADINMFVGLVNLFPMLPLDGGHVVIAVYERLRSRRGRRYHADVLKLLPVAYVFLALIVVLGLGALYANIVQPVHLPGG